MNSKNSRKYFIFFYVLFIMNLIFSKEEIINYKMEISIGKPTLDIFHIDYDDICKKWIPSLLSPIILVFPDNDIQNYFSSKNFSDKFSINNPYEINENKLNIYIYNYDFLNQKYNVSLGKIKEIYDSGLCYFGLLSNVGVNKQLDLNYILLKSLSDSNQIDKKIFSFSEWIISNKTITTNFFLGNSHNHFTSKKDKGIVGTCMTNKSELYWGCSFDQISYNGKIENLTQKDINFKIYFSSENHTAIFPLEFKNNFDILTDGKCTYDESAHKDEPEHYLSCDALFNKENYFLISLINKDMNITIEIDNNKRFNNGENIDGRTRISYEPVNYFILPLIMFKHFHVEFDDEEDLIKFYTTDESILKVNNKENKKDNKKNGKSKGLIVFLIILIIIIILALIYLALLVIKKRRSSVRNNINKYNKFEDEEDFKDMNEKRVF